MLNENLEVETVSEEGNSGIFDIKGLYRGYGLTLGTALRRVLLSSLPGAAITQVKIKGVGHEFTTIDDVLEDVVEITLNLKKVRFEILSEELGYNEPVLVTLKKKGEGKVTAKDIDAKGSIRVTNPDQHIATITSKTTELEIELMVERGLGYVPSEEFKGGALPVGTIQLDALFSPVKKANFVVENMRVGRDTNFNKLRLSIETDGGITPSEALKESFIILNNHLARAITQFGGDPMDTSEDPLKALVDKKAEERAKEEEGEVENIEAVKEKKKAKKAK